jgi:hypothetical protein
MCLSKPQKNIPVDIFIVLHEALTTTAQQKSEHALNCTCTFRDQPKRTTAVRTNTQSTNAASQILLACPG